MGKGYEYDMWVMVWEISILSYSHVWHLGMAYGLEVGNKCTIDKNTPFIYKGFHFTYGSCIILHAKPHISIETQTLTGI